MQHFELFGLYEVRFQSDHPRVLAPIVVEIQLNHILKFDHVVKQAEHLVFEAVQR